MTELSPVSYHAHEVVVLSQWAYRAMLSPCRGRLATPPSLQNLPTSGASEESNHCHSHASRRASNTYPHRKDVDWRLGDLVL